MTKVTIEVDSPKNKIAVGNYYLRGGEDLYLLISVPTDTEECYVVLINCEDGCAELRTPVRVLDCSDISHSEWGKIVKYGEEFFEVVSEIHHLITI